jgi:hypothetical protein
MKSDATNELDVYLLRELVIEALLSASKLREQHLATSAGISLCETLEQRLIRALTTLDSMPILKQPEVDYDIPF